MLVDFLQLTKKYNAEIDKAIKIIDNMKDPNKVIEQFESLENIWDVKKRVFKLLKMKAADLGYKYENKEFVKEVKENEKAVSDQNVA